MKDKTSRKIQKKRISRAKRICAAMKRAQIAAAKKALAFGQKLYVARRGKVVEVDPHQVLKSAAAI